MEKKSEKNRVKKVIDYMLRIAAFLPAIFFCGFVGFIGFNLYKSCKNSIESDKKAAAEAKRESDFKVSVLDSVFVSNFIWRTVEKSPLESTNEYILKATFTVNNASEYPIKDFVIACSVFAKSGTHLGTNTKIIYDIVEPNNKKIFKDMNIDSINEQAEKVECKVTDAVIVR